LAPFEQASQLRKGEEEKIDTTKLAIDSTCTSAQIFFLFDVLDIPLNGVHSLMLC
jgi:hypothetical protein